MLHGFDRVAFAEALSSQVIGVAFDGAAARSPEGRTTLDLSVNLLARLYPRLAVVPLDVSARNAAEEMCRDARAINPEIEIGCELAGVTACLAVGTTKVATDARTVYVGSDGWLLRLSPTEPVRSGATLNPFGAAAAACFGVANVFRIAFAQHLPHGGPDGQFTLSVFDFEPNAPSPTNPPLGPINLGEGHLAGVGAIGNGAVWTLTRLGRLRGTLHLIDHELIELTNLQRYVLAVQGDTESPKVTLASNALRKTGLDVRLYQGRWGDYLRDSGHWRLERVAVAVDSAKDRIAVQASLPRWVVNAWTQPDNLGVSRHEFLGDQACLACLYMPRGRQPDEDELVAAAIHLPDARMEVRRLLYSNAPVGKPFIERIATALTVPVDPLLPFADKPLRAFYSEAVCGGVLLKLGGGNGANTRVYVPMAFQSALAGVLLAAELVAHAAGLKHVPPPTTTTVNLLRPLAAYLSFREAKSASGRCLCQDADYTAAYEAKYPEPEHSHKKRRARAVSPRRRPRPAGPG